MTRDVTVRPLAITDDPLLAAATLDNLNWSEHRFTRDDVRERSDFRHYTKLVPERGDFGLVAEDAGGCLAVAWAVFSLRMTLATASSMSPPQSSVSG